MSTTESIYLIGKRGQYRPGKTLVFDVTVVDVREAYGRTDLRITPVTGTGQQWVSSDSVQIQPQ